mgnify:CR=1 FL=1|jgi:hypothetical protein
MTEDLQEPRITGDTHKHPLSAKEASAKTRKAFLSAAIGALLCVSSFVLTYLLSHHDRSFTFALYGMTMLGVVFIFLGLVLFCE